MEKSLKEKVDTSNTAKNVKKLIVVIKMELTEKQEKYNNNMEKEEKYGKKYLEAINKVLKIRAERKEVYGDSFLDDSIESLLYIIDGKRNRYDVIKKSKENFNKLEDQIVDIINYYVFILCLLENEKNINS